MLGALDESAPLGMHQENQSLQFQVGERDVEIERMKTTLMALNEKLQVLTNIKEDVEETRQYFATSENKRVLLQESMKRTSINI